MCKKTDALYADFAYFAYGSYSIGSESTVHLGLPDMVNSSATKLPYESVLLILCSPINETEVAQFVCCD